MTIRSEAHPKSGQSLNAAVVVRSEAPVTVGAHDNGPLIRSRNGFWLAIPALAACKSLRGGRMTPSVWERRNGLRLRFVYRRSGPCLLVAAGRLNTKGRVVRSPSKTDRGADLSACATGQAAQTAGSGTGCDAGTDALPGLIAGNWVEEDGLANNGVAANLIPHTP